MLVLGAGIVGRAAAWDVGRRGYGVTVADADAKTAASVANEFGFEWKEVDATNLDAVAKALANHDAVVSAVPYKLGTILARQAVSSGSHYFDLGGNPTIVKQQLALDLAAKAAGVAVVPDCGLAPGLANVIASGLISDLSPERVTNVQIRVGVLPKEPVGALAYQLAFNAAGLVNEYAEPCEVIIDGVARTVEPLSRFETIQWDESTTLEAFSTAGGTSTMCQEYAGVVDQLEYKTLRYPGHGQVFAAMRELGLFDTKPQIYGDGTVSPRSVLVEQLTKALPSGGADVTYLDVRVEAASQTASMRLCDDDDGHFSSLARTTAFPTTALCDLVMRGEVAFRGAAAMHSVAQSAVLMAELEQVGIVGQLG